MGLWSGEGVSGDPQSSVESQLSPASQSPRMEEGEK